MKLVFAGTPEAALPSLRALLDSRHEVAAVVTRPDAPTGRGRKVAPSPVARYAAEAGLEVLEPRRANDPDFLARLRQIGPDCCPVVAYGALLRPEALVIPPYGWVNLHFSVLPAWRGAGPVPAAIRAGDDITGASTFRIVQDLDAGPVFGTVTEAIRTEDTAGNLIERLADSGARLLLDTLDGIESGALTPREQPAEGVSYAPKVTADNARVDWNVPAAVVERGIRAHTPDPGAWATFRGERVKLGPVEVDPREVSSVEVGTQMSEATEEAAERAPEGGPGGSTDEEDGRDPLGPGEIRARKHSVHVGTATAPVRLRQVQPKGKRPMAAEDWARGVRPADGESLG